MPTPTNYWKFNNSLSDYYSSFNLSAGSGNTYDSSGKLNQAILWDGSGSYAAGSTAGYLVTTSGWTICGWIRKRSSGGAPGLLLNNGYNDAFGPGVSLKVGYNSGTSKFQLSDPITGNFSPTDFGSTITTGTWYFFYVRCDLNDAIPRFYAAINMGTETQTSADSGANGWNELFIYDSIDDLRLFNTKLTTTDLSAIYNGGSPSEIGGSTQHSVNNNTIARILKTNTKTAATSLRKTITTNNIIHYYKFNTNLLDSIGTTHLTSAAEAYRTGIANQALAAQAYNTPNTNVLIPAGDWTICFWFDPTLETYNVGYKQYYLLKISNYNDVNEFWVAWNKGPYGYVYELTNGYLDTGNSLAASSIPLSTWYFVAIRCTSGVMSVSVNLANMGNVDNSYTYNLFNVDLYNLVVDNCVDDLRIFSTSLTNTDLTTIYNNGYPKEIGFSNITPYKTHLTNASLRFASVFNKTNQRLIAKRTLTHTINSLKYKPVIFNTIARMSGTVTKTTKTNSTSYALWLQRKQFSSSNSSSSYGSSVSISQNGLYAVVGEPNTTNGQVSVYARANSNQSWTIMQVLLATDGTSGDKFGYNVFITKDASYIYVGAPQANSAAGAVYVFKLGAITYGQTQKITAPTYAGQFGYAIAASESGTYLAVGAPTSTYPANPTNSGATYYYSLSGGTYSLSQSIVPADSGSQSGSALAMTGDGATLLVGAPYRNISGKSPQVGTCRVYTYSAGSYSLSATLYDATESTYHFEGIAVACDINANTIITGGTGSTTDFPGGAVHIYKYNGSTWVLNTVINGSTVSSNDYKFGCSIALSPDAVHLAVGAKAKSTYGTTVIYRYYAGSYNKIEDLIGYDTSGTDAFGSSVAMSKDTAQPVTLGVGAPGRTYGTVYFYSLATVQLTLLTNSKLSAIKYTTTNINKINTGSKYSATNSYRTLSTSKIIITNLLKSKSNSITTKTNSILKARTTSIYYNNSYLKQSTAKSQFINSLLRVQNSQTYRSNTLKKASYAITHKINALFKSLATILNKTNARASKTLSIGASNNAFIKSTRSITNITNSLLRVTSSRTQNVNARFTGIKLTNTSSLIRKTFFKLSITVSRLIALQTRTILSNSLLKYSASYLNKTNILIRITTSSSVKTNALLKAFKSLTLNLASLLKATRSFNYYITALLKSSNTKTSNINALLRGTNTRTYNINSLLKTLITKTYSIRSLLIKLNTKTFTFNALVRASSTKTIVTRTLLLSLNTKQHTTNVLKRSINTLLTVASSFLKSTGSKNQNTNTYKKATATKSFVLNSLLKQLASKYSNANTLIRISITKTITNSAYLKSTGTKQHIAVARFIKLNSKSFSSASSLRSGTSALNSISILVKSSFTRINKSNSLIYIFNTKTVTFSGLLKAAITKSQPTNARISGIKSSYVSSKILKSSIKTLDTRSLLKFSANKTLNVSSLFIKLLSKQQITSVYLRSSTSKVYVISGLLRSSVSKQVSNYSLLKLSTTKTFSSRALLILLATKTDKTNSLLRLSATKSQSTNSQTTKKTIYAQSADMLRLLSVTRADKTNAYLLSVNTKFIKLNTLLRKTSSLLQYTASRLLKTSVKNISSNILKLARNSRTTLINSLLKSTTTSFFYTNSLLRSGNVLSNSLSALNIALRSFIMRSISLLKVSYTYVYNIVGFLKSANSLILTSDMLILKSISKVQSLNSLRIRAFSKNYTLNAIIRATFNTTLNINSFLRSISIKLSRSNALVLKTQAKQQSVDNLKFLRSSAFSSLDSYNLVSVREQFISARIMMFGDVHKTSINIVKELSVFADTSAFVRFGKSYNQSIGTYLLKIYAGSGVSSFNPPSSDSHGVFVAAVDDGRLKKVIVNNRKILVKGGWGSRDIRPNETIECVTPLCDSTIDTTLADNNVPNVTPQVVDFVPGVLPNLSVKAEKPKPAALNAMMNNIMVARRSSAVTDFVVPSDLQAIAVKAEAVVSGPPAGSAPIQDAPAAFKKPKLRISGNKFVTLPKKSLK